MNSKNNQETLRIKFINRKPNTKRLARVSATIGSDSNSSDSHNYVKHIPLEPRQTLGEAFNRLRADVPCYTGGVYIICI